jgi:hypothetical protein
MPKGTFEVVVGGRDQRVVEKPEHFVLSTAQMLVKSGGLGNFRKIHPNNVHDDIIL